MYAISDAFRQALTTSHRIVTRVDAYYGGQLVAADLPISDGSVTVDRGSKTRRSLSLTVADVKYLPWNPADPLAVYGQELRVQRGIQFASGPEMVPLGTFRINEPSADVHDGPVTLTGTTRESAIIDALFMVPTTTKGYGNCVQAIEFLIRQVIPDAPIENLTGRNPSCPVATWDAGADRWDAVTKIATAMRAEIFVDAIGRFVIVNQPDPINTPVSWTIAEGEGGTLISAARQMTRTGVFNAVVVSGENTASDALPVSGVAYDNDPSSPTRWGGPYGKVPKMYTSALVVTQGDANALANYMLTDLTAPNIQTSIDSLPNPALEAGDCVKVEYARRKERFIVQSLTIPLTAEGDFSITLRGGKEDVEE
ncbi:DUF5047 domain-containing protein [Streptomyces silvensis]|uniref:Peptidase n=1 Tax=Streptomyces silvensis TaxID=1765722 RepID=A0A0W7X7P3_9ACTN|nr:DUF5047 domain-containing protein [Streptomyces silvensis]KUF18863.1 peptidase [Streptomyces silvensis]